MGRPRAALKGEEIHHGAGKEIDIAMGESSVPCEEESCMAGGDVAQEERIDGHVVSGTSEGVLEMEEVKCGDSTCWRGLKCGDSPWCVAEKAVGRGDNEVNLGAKTVGTGIPIRAGSCTTPQH